MSWPHHRLLPKSSAFVASRLGLIALLAGATLLYLFTLDNGLRPGELAGGDLITHQYAQVQARPSNAPGYPLYTLGGWLWFHAGRLLAPQISPLHLLAAYSTLWALLALALLYRLLLRLTAGHWPIAWLVSALYAVTYFFWYYAVATEQYTSAVLHTLLIVWAFCRWDDARLASAHADRWLVLLALLCGLALAHLITVLAIAPPLAWLIWRQRPPGWQRLSATRLAALLAVGLLPLLGYIFIYVRGAQHPEWRGAGAWPTTWAWFWSFISTGQGRSELTWNLRPLWTSEWPALFWRELTLPATLAGLAGWAWLNRRLGSLLAVTALIYGIFSFIDRLGNWYQVVMPVYALLALGLGVAVQRSAQWASAHPTGWKRPLPALLLIALLLLGANRLLVNFPRANQANRAGDTGLAPGWALLDGSPPGAQILGLAAEADALRYLTIIGGVRPDVHSVDSAGARALLARNEPLLVSVSAAPLIAQEVLAQPRWQAVSPTLLQALPAPQLAPPNSSVASTFIGDGLALQQVTARLQAPARPAGWPAWAPVVPDAVALQVSLVWLAQAQPQHDWSISLRPLRAGQFLYEGDRLLQLDMRHPVAGFYPTSAWTPGEQIQDIYRLPLPPGPHPDSAQIVIYRSLPDGRFENLYSIEIGAF